MPGKAIKRIFHKYYPREHGAWVILILQLVLGVSIVKGFTLPMFLFAVVIVAMYSWVKPFCDVVRSGGEPPSERRQLIVYLAVLSVVVGACMAALVLYYRFYSMIWIGAVGLAVGWASIKSRLDRTEKEFVNEIIGVISLTLCLPGLLYLGKGSVDRFVIGLWFGNILFYWASVFYVRTKSAAIHNRKDPAVYAYWRNLSFGYHLLTLPVAGGLQVAGLLPSWGWLAFLPVVAKQAANLPFPREKVRLNKVGIAESLYSLAFTIILIALCHRAGESASG